MQIARKQWTGRANEENILSLLTEFSWIKGTKPTNWGSIDNAR